MTSKNDNQSDLFEKLREELFKYRVSIESYKMNINTIIVCATIIISVIAFFGYNKVDGIQEIVIEKTNKRLMKTDSLLAKIDQKKIDSLNTVLVKKEIEFKNTIKNFDIVINSNIELQTKLLSSLADNPIVTHTEIKSYMPEYQSDYFDIRPFKQNIKLGELINIYLIFKENVNLKSIEYIGLKLYPNRRNILLSDKFYQINGKLNKLSFKVGEKFENQTIYRLEIGIYIKTNNTYRYLYSYSNLLIK